MAVIRYSGLVFRAHNPRWAFSPLSGQGAALHGGRFNRRGQPALYTSLRMETAWLEAQQAFPFKPQPLTICAYEVDCQDIVDLTDPAEQARVGALPEILSCAWEYLLHLNQQPPTWRLADRLRVEGAAGILAPSFAPGAGWRDFNLVLWIWEEKAPHLEIGRAHV